MNHQFGCVLKFRVRVSKKKGKKDEIENENNFGAYISHVYNSSELYRLTVCNVVKGQGERSSWRNIESGLTKVQVKA